MAHSNIDYWLIIASHATLTASGLSLAVLVATQLKRFHTVKIDWPSKIILVLLMANLMLGIIPEAASYGLPGAARTLVTSLIMLTICGFIWPLSRQLNRQPPHTGMPDTVASDFQHWLQRAQKIAHVGHWHYDVAEDRLSWSDEIYRIYGICNADSSARPALNMALMVKSCHPEDRENLTLCLQNAVISQKDFELFTRLVRMSGELRHVMLRGVVEKDDKGRASSIFGVLMDITEQKTIELELKDANAASERANESLREMAMHDGLTGLPNRRNFDATLGAEFKRAAREKTTLGLAMIDLDNFKAYNDRYGHPAGDECLRQVAEAIAGVLQRPADLAARYGGEEMVVLLPNTNLIGSEIVAKLVLQAVRDLRLTHEGNQSGIVTISCGIATFSPAIDPHVSMMLVERADQALYQAKLEGRNCVKSYNSRMSADSIN